MVVCDVGAHVGTHTLKLARLVGPDGVVVAMEPNRSNFERLSRNLAANHVENVIAIEAALGPRNETMKLYYHGGSMYPSLARQSDRFDLVDVLDFETLFSRAILTHVDFMKLDIEGAEEPLLLAPSADFLAMRPIDSLYVDQHSGVDYGSITERMASLGYGCRRLEGGYLYRQSPGLEDHPPDARRISAPV